MCAGGSSCAGERDKAIAEEEIVSHNNNFKQMLIKCFLPLKKWIRYNNRTV